MEPMNPTTDSFKCKKEVTIPQNSNTLVVRLKGHTWVTVSVGDRRILRSKTSQPVVSFSVSPGTYIVETDGDIQSLTSETRKTLPSLEDLLQQQKSLSLLRLTSDAPDRHLVDGIGEIPADGTSSCTITIEKISYDGKPLSGTEHQDELFLRSTGGILMDAAGEKRIRSLRIESGKAQFRLVSEPNPKVVTVTVLGQKPELLKSEIQIEFVP